MGANNLAKLRSLVEVARALQNSLSTQEVLTAVVDAALAVTGCERGFLLLRNGAELDVSVARDHDGQRARSRRSARAPQRDPARVEHPPRSAVDALRSAGRAGRPPGDEHRRAGTAQRGLRAAGSDSQRNVRRDSRSRQHRGHHRPAVYGFARRRPPIFPPAIGSCLQTLAIEASTILENARLFEEERVKVRMEDELKIARDIQQGLLPAALPSIGWFRAAGSSMPSHAGGRRLFRRPPGLAGRVGRRGGRRFRQGRQLGAAGEPAARLVSDGGAGHIESIHRPPEHISAGAHARRKIRDHFLLHLDSSGLLSYSNAGHPAPFLVSPDGRLRKLHTSGMPVGMIENAPFQMVQTQLAAGRQSRDLQRRPHRSRKRRGSLLRHRAPARLPARQRRARRRRAACGSARAAVDRFTDGGVIRDDITALVIEYAPA